MYNHVHIHAAICLFMFVLPPNQQIILYTRLYVTISFKTDSRFPIRVCLDMPVIADVFGVLHYGGPVS